MKDSLLGPHDTYRYVECPNHDETLINICADFWVISNRFKTTSDTPTAGLLANQKTWTLVTISAF